jgi:hypothetical protein
MIWQSRISQLLFCRLDSPPRPIKVSSALTTAPTPMKKILLALTSLLTTLVLPGCFQNETTIHLNKDGSGTLVEETRLGAQMLAIFDQMATLGDAANAKEDPVAKMFSEDQAKTRAADLGEGVVFEKSEAIKANGSRGARVTYRFKDINQLKLSPGDSMKNMSPMGAAGTPAVKKSAPIAFAYAAGKLTIKMPDPAKANIPEAPADEEANSPDMDNPETQAMMKQMLGDMTLSLKVVIEPGITETNATYQAGNTLTLMQMDMGKLLEKPDTLKKLGKVDKHNPAAALHLLKDIEGAKFETQKEVTVKVQ